jgi:uncharacterized protein YgbK (DUF1537 family)
MNRQIYVILQKGVVVVHSMKQKTNEQIGQMIANTKRDLAKFTLSLRKAPKEKKNEYILWARSAKKQLQEMENTFNSRA